jgi:hypothetical protein
MSSATMLRVMLEQEAIIKRPYPHFLCILQLFLLPMAVMRLLRGGYGVVDGCEGSLTGRRTFLSPSAPPRRAAAAISCILLQPRMGTRSRERALLEMAVVVKLGWRAGEHIHTLSRPNPSGQHL